MGSIALADRVRQAKEYLKNQKGDLHVQGTENHGSLVLEFAIKGVHGFVIGIQFDKEDCEFNYKTLSHAYIELAEMVRKVSD